MILEYKNFVAEVAYSAITKCYYGEIVAGDRLYTFQASTRQEILDAIKQVVDQCFGLAQAV